MPAKKKRRPKRELEGVRTRITPQMAMEWLEAMPLNRTVRQHVVNQYARDIKNGEWKENGETIKIDRNGNLIDGQHRLWAIVEAGKPIYSLVVEGVDPESMLTVDSGMNRKFHDHLHLAHGVSDVHILASAVRMQWFFENTGTPCSRGRGRKGKLMRPSHAELEECYERHPMLASVVRGARLKPQFIPRAILGWFLYQVTNVDAAEAEQFHQDLKDGAGLPKNDPVNKLRTRMLINHGSREKLDSDVVVGFLYKCWHARRKNRSIHVLRYSPGEELPPLGS